MPKIVECVPNFSDGRNKEVIEAIVKAIGSTPGCSLLDVAPGPSTNRTVFTFVGTPNDVVEGALAGAMASAMCIDMSTHTGEHPRIGALDVCPFVPVQDVTMEECVECARQFSSRLASTLEVPVYLYGFAAEHDYRRNIPQIRQGEYEGLEQKLTQKEWAPDFGPAIFEPKWGATIAGARNFLVAYNINLLGTKEQAHRIALNIREQGRGEHQPGKLKNVQAIGWYLEEANMAQVSVNITDITTTAVHTVFEECAKDAKEMNLTVLGSEVVGLLPKSCLLDAARYYMERDNLFILEEEHMIRLAIHRLGLNTLKQFNPKEKVIECMLERDEGSSPFSSLEVRDFVSSVSSRTAVPGGGSVAALIGSLGAGLNSMAGLLTYGNRKFELLDSTMRKLIPPLYTTSQRLVPMIDADSQAYKQFMEAGKLPSDTEEHKASKAAAKQAALENAIEVPMTVSRMVNSVWPTLKELAPVANEQCLSDVLVGVRCLQTAVWGAYYNVMTNVKIMPDGEQKTEIVTTVKKELAIMEAESKIVLDLVTARC